MQTPSPSVKEPKIVSAEVINTKIETLQKKYAEVTKQLEQISTQAVELQESADRTVQAKNAIEAQIRILQSLLQ